MQKIFAVSLSLIAAISVSAAEYWVDRSQANDDGDGKTKATAKRTLQAGVDLLGDGDTLWVCPGDYDEGGGIVSSVSLQTNRVNILNKNNILIKSTDGKAVTRIVGKHAGNGGIGADAVRCVFVNGATSTNIRIEGFTFLNGASGTGDNASSVTCGGGFYGRNVSGTHYEYNKIVDCDFIGCTALYGGAIRSATAIRCRFMGCQANITKHASVIYQGAALNCLFNQNFNGQNVIREVEAYNCTFADNMSASGSLQYGPIYNSTIVNCAVLHNAASMVGNGKGASIIAKNCVLSEIVEIDYESKENCVQQTVSYQFVAPLYDDYRLLAGSDCVAAGSAEALAEFPYASGEDLYLDLDRKPIAQTGAVAAGCHQTAIEPGGGAIKMNGGVNYTTRGLQPKTGDLYAFAEHWPTQFLVEGVSTVSKRIVFFNIGGATVYPLLDDTVWVLPPESSEDVLTIEPVVSSTIRYVNDATGRDDDAEYDGKTPDKPYKTIQRGVDDFPSVVVVAPGDYDEGERYVEGYGVSNRLAVVFTGTAGRGMRIIGEAGAERTVIRGKSATYDVYADNEGCGPDAVRCIYANESCCIQGFTIADGRVAGGTGDMLTSGGGVFGLWNSEKVRVYDCIITNCAAYRGDICHGGDYRRCKIVDCGNGFGQPSRYASFKFCSFSGIKLKANTNLTDDQSAYNCTILGRSTADGMFRSECVATRYNCIIANADRVPAALGLQGCLVYGSANVAAAGGFVSGNPFFVDESKGDTRLMPCTKAMGIGVIYENASAYMIGDINGKPMRFAGGKPMAGAYQTTTPVIVASASDTYGEQNWSGTRELVPGETITITATDAENRHCAGFRVNGEDVFSNPASWTVTLPDVLNGDEMFEVSPIWSTNWYVNANIDPAKGPVGNDDNDGFTPETAKRTLKAILESEHVLAGDCIHAAPGVYDEGDMDQLYAARHDSLMTTKVRACIKPNVTLVGDGGAERTIIKGYRNAERFESVTEGVRCVNVGRGAKVIGFTLTGGSTPYISSSGEKEPYLGGAVVAPVDNTTGYPWAIVSDCIISNNWACRGAGAFGGLLLNCKVSENYATESGVAAMATALYNCLIDRNYNNSAEKGASLVRYPYGIFSCTLTASNYEKGTDKPIKYHVTSWADSGKKSFANSIVMGSLSDGVEHALVNCILNKDAASLGADAAWTNVKKLSVPEMKLDGVTFVPAQDSPAVDGGSMNYLRDMYDNGFTLDGAQRIYNGVIDIGCREFDYRPVFAQAMGGGAKVEYASKGVTLDGGAVKLTDGERIAGTTDPTVNRGRYSVETHAAGEGALSGVIANEEAGFEKTIVAANDEQALSFRLKGIGLDFEFAYSGDGSGWIDTLSLVDPGFVLMLR